MPEVYVHAIKGRTQEQKRALIKDISDAVEDDPDIVRAGLERVVHDLAGRARRVLVPALTLRLDCAASGEERELIRRRQLLEVVRLPLDLGHVANVRHGYVESSGGSIARAAVAVRVRFNRVIHDVLQVR